MTPVQTEPAPDTPGAERATTTIHLVRHASAGQRGGYDQGPDRDRPLDDVGRQQAQLIADVIGPVDSIVSSTFARCVQTVKPLADANGIPVETDEALEELTGVPITEAGSAWVTPAWLGGRALGLVERLLVTGVPRIVLCSHGDVVPALMAALAGRDRLGLSDVRCRKAGRYVLEFVDGHCVRAELAPPPDTSPGRGPGPTPRRSRR